jgi:hypothetical protein
MLKKVLKLLSLYQAARHGHSYGSSQGPWKRKKWKGHKHRRYGSHGYPPYPPPHGYGSDHAPYSYGRSRGLKGVIIDAIMRKLLKHR